MDRLNQQLDELQCTVAELEKHVGEQDAEIYRLSCRVDALVKVAKEQKAQLAAIAELRSGDASDSPAHEKPPHY